METFPPTSICTRSPEHDGPCNGVPARTCRAGSWAGYTASTIAQYMEQFVAAVPDPKHAELIKLSFVAGYRTALLGLLEGSINRSGRAARASKEELQALADALKPKTDG